MKDLVRFNDEVYYFSDKISTFSQSHVNFLTEQADKNNRSRCRLSTHSDADALMHEMFIMHKKGNYVPPHSHSNSDESLTLLSGEGAMLYFDDNVELEQIIYLNADIKKGINYVRTPTGQLHSLFIFSEHFLFKETVLGPFIRESMNEMTWASVENNSEGWDKFLQFSEQQFFQVKANYDC